MGSAPSTRATRSRPRVRPAGSTARREVPGAAEGRVRLDFGEQQETLPADRRRLSSARSTVVHMVPEQPAWPRCTRETDSHQGQAPWTLSLKAVTIRRQEGGAPSTRRVPRRPVDPRLVAVLLSFSSMAAPDVNAIWFSEHGRQLASALLSPRSVTVWIDTAPHRVEQLHAMHPNFSLGEPA